MGRPKKKHPPRRDVFGNIIKLSLEEQVYTDKNGVEHCFHKNGTPIKTDIDKMLKKISICEQTDRDFSNKFDMWVPFYIDNKETILKENYGVWIAIENKFVHDPYYGFYRVSLGRIIKVTPNGAKDNGGTWIPIPLLNKLKDSIVKFTPIDKAGRILTEGPKLDSRGRRLTLKKKFLINIKQQTKNKDFTNLVTWTVDKEYPRREIPDNLVGRYVAVEYREYHDPYFGKYRLKYHKRLRVYKHGVCDVKGNWIPVPLINQFSDILVKFSEFSDGGK